jgi:hypothetical protein
VRICARAFELFVRQAEEAQINSEFPTFGLGLLRRALAAGYGQEEAGAVVKVLRAGAQLFKYGQKIGHHPPQLKPTFRHLPISSHVIFLTICPTPKA